LLTWEKMTQETKTIDTSEQTSGYAWYALGLLCTVYMINFIDRQILSILAEDIKADLQLTDAHLGFLYGTAFAIFYTLFGIPLGRLADTWYRGRLMALGLTVWSSMTALSGFASSYLQLALARVGVGIGEASASPAAFSLLADYFPKRRRALAMAIYSAGLYIGMGLSLPLGGWIASTWERRYAAGGAPLDLAGWQAAFIAVGIPGLLIAVLVALLREPLRGASDGTPTAVVKPGAWPAFFSELAAVLPPITLWRVSRIPGALRINLLAACVVIAAAAALVALSGDLPQWTAYGVGCYAVFSWIQVLRSTDPATHRLVWGSPTVLFCIVGFGALAYFVYAFGFWVAPYAIRNFHIAKQAAGAYLGLPGAVASAFGVIVGGRLSDWWKERDARGRIYVGMLSGLLPAPFVVAMFTTDSFSVYTWISPIVYCFSSLWVGSAVAAYQDFVLPRMRGVVGATYLLGSTMVGLALGPYITGKIATVSGSLSSGVLSILIVAPVSLLALWLASRGAAQTELSKFERAAAAEQGQ
jgi:MFS family permease